MSEKTKIDLDDPRALLSEAQAAKFLGYSRSSLNQWRVKGKGPEFVKLDTGTVRYRKSVLVEWLEKHSVSVQSTSEAKVG